MAKDEYYSFEEFYEKNKKEPAEVKKLISEGAIQVFREADQVKLKHSPEALAEAKKKKVRKRRLTEEENQYYTTSSQRFRDEIWTLVAAAIWMGFVSLLICALLGAAEGVLLQIARFFLGLAAVSFLATIFLAVLANSFFTRYIVLGGQQTRSGDKKNLLFFFTKGYCYKQSAKAVWIAGCDSLALFVVFQLMSHSILSSILLLLTGIAMTFALHYYMYHIENAFNSKSPRKPLPFFEEDVSNVFPGIIPKEPEEKPDIDDKVMLLSLTAALKNSNSRVRKDIVKALGRIGTPEAINTLVASLGDPEPEIRAQAISVLANTDDKSVHEAIKCLFYDDSPDVRAAVSEFFGYLQEEDSLDSLLAALEDPSPEVRGAAAEGLGRLGKRKAVKYLVPKTKDEDWFVRHKAVIALGRMKADLSIDAIEHLIEAVSDDHEYVSLAAEHILRKLAEEMAGDDPLYDEVVTALQKKGAADLESSPKQGEGEGKKATAAKPEEKPKEPKEEPTSVEDTASEGKASKQEQSLEPKKAEEGSSENWEELEENGR